MYTPKNRILTNQYTRNNKLAVSASGEFYTGHYHKLYNGKMYTGKTPNDPPILELIEVEPTDENFAPELPQTELAYTDAPTIFSSLSTPGYDEGMVVDYARINNINLDKPQRKFLPYSFYPQPTEEQYEIGSFPRYFCLKYNEPIFTELNKEVFDALKNQDNKYQWELFAPFKLTWTLIGDPDYVKTTNRNIIKLTEKRLKIRGLDIFLRQNYLQFYKPTEVQINLVTDGTEYINRTTGLAYKGAYHIHPDKGPMVGATHISASHDYLDPVVSFTTPETTETPQVRPSSGGMTRSGGGGTTRSSGGGGGGGY